MNVTDGLVQALEIWRDAPEAGPPPGTAEIRAAYKAGGELPDGTEAWVLARAELLTEGNKVLDELHAREGNPQFGTVMVENEAGEMIPEQVVDLPRWWGKPWHNTLMHWPWAEDYEMALAEGRAQLAL